MPFRVSLSSVVVKNSLLNCFLTERGSLDYARNVAKTFDEPEPDYPLSNSKHVSSRASCLNFHHADSKRSSHDKEETRKTHCSCSFCVLRGPSCFSTQSRNSQPDIHQFFFSFWPRHYSLNKYTTTHWGFPGLYCNDQRANSPKSPKELSIL